MNITQREENGVTVFDLEGRIDSEGSVELEHALQNALDAGQHKMILDMSRVQYLNSAGLRTLADVLTTNKENGGDLRLVALSRKVQRVFQIIGFDKFFQMYDDLEAAQQEF
jgi:anti-sigma B factor antagonist